MHAKLVFLKGTEEVGEYVLRTGRTIVVGRGKKADIFLDDPTISRGHLSLQLSDTGLYVTDLDSSNGTLVGGQRIRPRHSSLFIPGDGISLGDHSIQVHLAGEAWEIMDPIIQGLAAPDAPLPAGYAIGSTGPEAADRFLAKDGRQWLHQAGLH